MKICAVEMARNDAIAYYRNATTDSTDSLPPSPPTRLNFKMNNEEQIGSLADSTVPYLVRSCGTYLYRYAEENGSFNTTNEKIKYD